MAIQIRTEQQRNSDLVRISKLYLQGHTQLEIAQQIGVSRTQISYDIKQYENCKNIAYYANYYGKANRCKEHRENRQLQYCILYMYVWKISPLFQLFNRNIRSIL